MKVLLTSTSLLPDYGGPAFSVSRLATALAEAGVEVGLWAADGSAATSELLPANAAIKRLVGTESQAFDSFQGTDVLHDNGIWLPHNHRLSVLAEKRGIPRVVSTRGMLEPWALKHKRLKKEVAWWLYQRRDLKQARRHVTSSAAETQNVQCLKLGVPVATVPNGVDVPEDGPRHTASEASTRSTRTALFLGRIYPIKGLPILIEAWSRVRPQGWRLRIAGPDEAGHQKQVERAVSTAGLGDVVVFTGPVEPQMKAATFFDADLFVLPTLSESFGMVVAEALAHGLPVLTTTAAPWAILQQQGCGWSVDPTVEAIAEGLRRATSLDRESLREMGSKGRTLVNQKFSWKTVAQLMLSTYQDVLTGDRSSEKERLQPV